ncbi:MAG: hypothetical protein RL693_1082, partial [Verrucomicrobiota bacterium]
LKQTGKDKALYRRAYIEELNRELGFVHAPALACQVIHKKWQELGWPKTPPSYTTVWRWGKRYSDSGKDIRAIVDRYGSSGNRERKLPKVLLQIINSTIDRVYMTLERGSCKETWDIAVSEVRRENLLRVATEQIPFPTLRQVKELIREIPAFDRHAARYGRRAAEIHFRSVLKKPVTSYPLERVEIDHTRLDVFVVDEETMLPLGRPWLTLCIDVHTRCILGVDLSFDPPSHASVARCLKHAILPKGDLQQLYPNVKGTWDMCGVMETLVCDNGPEFHGESLEVGCLTLGITLQYCPRKKPWFKGVVERTLGTLNRGIAHGIPGTTFSNIFQKGEYNPAKNAVLTLSTLKEIMHVWIVDFYHNSVHKTIRDTPAHAWLIDTKGRNIPLPADTNDLDATLGKYAVRELGISGVQINGLFYNSDDLTLLRRRLGTSLQVSIKYLEENLGEIFVLSPDSGNYIRVPAIDQAYAKGLTLWQHTVCKRFAKRVLDQRSDKITPADAKHRIIELVEASLGKKKTGARVRMARFMSNDPGHKPVETATVSRSLLTTQAIVEAARISSPVPTLFRPIVRPVAQAAEEMCHE